MFLSCISPKVFNIIVQYKRKCTSLSICPYKIYRIFRKLTCFLTTPLNLNGKWLNVHWFWLLWVHVYSNFWHIEAEIFFHLKWWSSFTMKSEVSCIIRFNLIKLSGKKNNYTIHRNMIKYSNPSLVTQTILCNNPRHIFLRTCVLSNNYGHHT
jgi:hypothetical protein